MSAPPRVKTARCPAGQGHAAHQLRFVAAQLEEPRPGELDEAEDDGAGRRAHDDRAAARVGRAARRAPGGSLSSESAAVPRYNFAVRSPDWKTRLRAEHLGTVEGLTLYRVEPGVYVQEVRGHLTAALMERSLRTAWDRPDFTTPYGVVHVIDAGITYDADIREFPDRPGIIAAAASVVVTDNALLRMVVAAIGIASRIKRGTRVSAYDDVLAAVEAVRGLVRG